METRSRRRGRVGGVVEEALEAHIVRFMPSRFPKAVQLEFGKELEAIGGRLMAIMAALKDESRLYTVESCAGSQLTPSRPAQSYCDY